MKLAKIFALLFVISISAGCASKSAPVDTTYEETTPQVVAIDVAAQTITDGIVYFAYNKYDIAPEFRDVLNQKAAIMRQYPSIRVRIEGHCDARGTQEYNLALGERRARVVYEYMVLLGVNPNQLEIISYGKEYPAVQGTGEQVWALNRRDNFRVVAR